MKKRNWKFYLGIALLIYGVLVYAVIAVLPFTGLSAVTAGSIAAGLLISDEIAFLAALALLGKPFIELVKGRIKGWFLPRAPRRPLRPISKRRHYVGVGLLFLSFLPYFGVEALLILGLVHEVHLKIIITLLLLSDSLFVAGLLVLGAGFWERLRKLFTWRGEGESLNHKV